MNNKPRSNDKYEKLPISCKISLILAGVCLFIYSVSLISEDIADFFNFRIASVFRFLFAKLTDILPFSLSEALIVTLPITASLLIWYILKYRCNTPRATRTSLLCIISVASLFFSSFTLTVATGYQGKTLSEKLGLEIKKVSAQELYESAEYLVDRINELSPDIVYSNDGFSENPHDLQETGEKLIKSFDAFSSENRFIKNFKSRLKPVMLSNALSRMHVTGVYTFFTGEVNINSDFPDYTIPFTAAHELAHQRGVSREDEANMIAFLICIGSEDSYIRYCGYLNMYEYISEALYQADAKLFKRVDGRLSPLVRRELLAYGDFFDEYESTVESEATGALNDAYLKTQGTVGKKSYGLVVDLVIAYFKKTSTVE